jgi:hypothetical protein
MASQFQYGPDNTLRMLATFTGPDKEKNTRRVQKQFEKYDVNGYGVLERAWGSD